MPTGVQLHDARQQLFDAAERVLLRGGASALTSRAVTDEAGCAKGVLYRHFADFDAFLTDLVLDRATRLEASATRLRKSAGSATIVENLTVALTEFFGPVAAAIVPLITFRDELRARLRQATPGGGIAVLGQATAAISAYLAAERDLGRITTNADLDSLTLSLVGGGHLLMTSHELAAPGDEVARLVVAAITTVSVVP